MSSFFYNIYGSKDERMLCELVLWVVETNRRIEMYYHVITETKKSEEYSVFDIADKNQIIEQYVKPYLMGDDFVINGYSVNKTDLKRFYVTETQYTAQQLLNAFYAKNHANGILAFTSRESMVQDDHFSKDITLELQTVIKDMLTAKLHTEKKSQQDLSNGVFIVHGRNDSVKNDIARFIEKIGLPAIILHEQPSSSATIIEKFEKFSNVGYAIILYTADDRGALAGENDMKSRARQNVLFEHGYFISKLGREREFVQS